MKAILEFDLPEEQDDHKYALAGVDALLVISDLGDEIRRKLKYNSGEFKEFDVEYYDEDSNVIKNKKVDGCDDTLIRVLEVLRQFKQERNIPELA
jgi:uncharacterized protein YacL (UPF0231 family)